jgi:hypothetical protein
VIRDVLTDPILILLLITTFRLFAILSFLPFVPLSATLPLLRMTSCSHPAFLVLGRFRSSDFKYTYGK